MKRTYIIATIASLLLVVMPNGLSGEVLNAEYDVPSGPAGNFSAGLSWNPCSPGWDDWSGTTDDPLVDGAITTGFSTTCGTGRDATGREGNHGVVNIGVHSTTLVSTCGDCYIDFLVSVTDTLPADTFYIVCVITEYQDGREDSDNWCGDGPEGTTDAEDDIEDPSATGCGVASLTSTVPAGGEENGFVAFIYASYVDESTGQTCLGSKGVLTVDMS